jgi:hypothetical protein
VQLVQAYSTRCLAQLAAAMLAALRHFAAQTKLEADAPTELILTDDTPTLLLQGKDWPFPSASARAVWLVVSAREATTALADAVEIVAEAALQTGAALRRRNGDAGHARELKREIKALATSVHLDSGAALALVHEAVGMLVPLMQYVALADAALDEPGL